MPTERMTVTQDLYEAAWPETWTLIASLWPGWKFNDVQRDLWRENLERRNPDAVRKVIREIATEQKSPVPKLAWVMDKLRGKQDRVHRAKKLEQGWMSDQQVEQQNLEIIQELKALPESRLADACALASDRCGKAIAINTNGSIDEWPRGTRGLVWAADHDLQMAGREGT